MGRPAQQLVQFFSPTDNQLLEFLKECWDYEGTTGITLFYGPVNSLTWDDDTNISNIRSKLAKSGKGRQISNVTISRVVKNTNNRDSRTSASFSRTQTQNDVASKSNLYSEIFFTDPNNHQDFVLFIVNLVETEFKSGVDVIDSTGQKDPLGLFVTQMSETATSISERLSNAQIEYDRKTQERLEKINDQAEEQQKKFDEQQKEREALFAEREAALAKKEDALNNAEARSERRGLRQRITDELKERQSAEITPPSARALRYPILGLGGIGLLAGLSFAYLSLNKFASKADGQTSDWILGSLLLRGSLGIFAATFFMYYLLKYLKDTERAAGRRAQELERNLFDIDRSSWVIETILDLKEEGGLSNVPRQWLEGATHNLFGADNSAKNNHDGPLDALGELLATGATLKMGSGGAEVELNPKAAKVTAKNKSKQGD